MEETQTVTCGATDSMTARAQALVRATSIGGGNAGGPGGAPEGGTSIAMDANGASVVGGVFSGPPTFGAGEMNETVLSGFGETDGLHARFDVVVPTTSETESSQGVGIELSANHPNAFVDKTVIEYRIGIATNVRLRIFDALGRRVGRLANGRRTPGVYTAVIRRGDLPAGVYFVVLEAGNTIVSRKVVAV